MGRPHDGPDVASNILCLCATHHAQLDYGGLQIAPDLSVTERHTGRVLGDLRTQTRHKIDQAALTYRRSLHP